MEEKGNKLASLYRSMMNPRDLERYRILDSDIEAAYKSRDYRKAERLEVELERLLDGMESALEDMDDSDGEDINTGNTGGEESHLDMDWSVQEELARRYAQYISGYLDSRLDDSETVEVDPEEARKKGWIVHQALDHNKKPLQSFYSYAPITKQKAFANMLRGVIWESPNLSTSNPIVDKIKSMTDEQIIDVAKDAYEWKRNLRNRIIQKPTWNPKV